MIAVPELVGPARAELQTHEKAGADPATVECWRRMLILVDTGELTLPDGERPAEAFAALLSVAHATLQHRAEQCAKAPSDALQRRIPALRSLRDLLMRSAIRAGAPLPSFNPPPERKVA